METAMSDKQPVAFTQIVAYRDTLVGLTPGGQVWIFDQYGGGWKKFGE